MMQNIFTNIKCSEIILSNANENWYIILYDLFSRLCYIATCGPFCKDATHLGLLTEIHEVVFRLIKTPNIHVFKMAAPTEDRFPQTIL